MTTQSKVATEKREHPERFCTAPGCLWRVKHVRGGADTPCPRHSDTDEAAAKRTYDRLCSKRSMSDTEWEQFEAAAKVLESFGHNLNGWR